MANKIKCVKCNQIFEIPKGDCPICFSDVLGEINDIKDSDKRFDALTEFINNLAVFDYERGLHNSKCENQLITGNFIGIEFIEEVKDKNES